MKAFIIILISFIPAFSIAQLIKASDKQWNSKEVLDRINDSTTYFIDTIKVDMSNLAQINPTDIATITAYFEDEPELPLLFTEYVANGVIHLITKRYAISKYRPELSKISDDYKEITKQHPAEHDSLVYIVDGDTLTPNVEGKLINMYFSKIHSIQVVFPKEAEKLFGDKARLGAVIINSRK